MKRVFLISCFFVCSCFAVDPSTGDGEVDAYLEQLDRQLATIAYNVGQADSSVLSSLNSARNTYEYYLRQAETSSSASYRAEGARAILSDLESAYNSCHSYCSTAMSAVDSARSDVVQLALLWSKPSGSNDLSLVIAAIEEHQRNMLDQFSQVQTNQMIVISNVVVMTKLLQEVFPASTSTNSSSSAVSSLSGHVNSLVIDFAHFWVTADNLLDYLDDVDGYFKQFYQNATERLKSPDHLCQSALRDMWFDLLDNRLRITSLTNLYLYPIDQQVEVVLQQLDPDTFRLSNEGVVALENLAVNQRSYLCLAELVNRPSGGNGVSNYVDLAWITNYLGTVQQPYYELYNKTFGPSQQYQIFIPTTFQYFTNFTASVNEPLRTRSTLWTRYRNSASNYWQRLEIALMSLNGWMDAGPSLDSQDDQEVDRNTDKENLTRNIEYSTNAFTSVINDYGSVSNSLSYLMVKFRSLTNSFALPEGSWDDIIRLTPQISLGNITIDPIYFDSTFFLPIQQAVRKVFTGIWYVIFIFIGFRLVLLVVYLLGKTIAHTFLILSTLLS